jgi:hypothetical protein
MIAIGRGATSIAEERERGTLDLLLVFPGDRAEILRAKHDAALRAGGRGAIWAMGGIAIVGLLDARLHPLSLPLWGLYVYGLLRATAAVAVWQSVRRKSSGAALAWTMAILGVAMLAPMMLTAVVAMTGAPGLITLRDFADFSPPRALEILLFQRGPGLLSPFWSYLSDRGPVAAIGCLGWLAVAVVAWRLAVRAFEREGRA